MKQFHFRKTGIRLLLGFAATMAATTGMQAQNFRGVQIPKPNLECSQTFKDVDYAGDGEVYHALDIYLPKEVKKSYPVVIHIYGSAWMSNNSKNMADLGTICKALLDAGYAVVTPNHRSSGDAHFPAQINDIKAVVRFLRANADKYSLDTSFIGVSGFSSGGHLASLTATSGGVAELEGNVGGNLEYSSSVDAVCSWSGPIDLLNMDCAGKRNMEHTPEEMLIGAPVQGNEDKYAAICPITYLDSADPPVMIFHGTADNVVPPCQAPEFYDALCNAGVDSRLIMVEGGGHGFNMYSEDNLAKMTEFFNDARSGKPVVNRFKPLVLEDYFTPSTTTAASPDNEGFIRRWSLLEPIDKPNRTNTVFTDNYLREAFSTKYFPNQMSIVPKDGEKVKVGKQKLAWHALDSKMYNVKLFRFASGLQQQVYGVLFWAVTTIDCPEDIDNVRMAVGSNSASMWWIDGKEMLLLSGDRRMVADDAASDRLSLSKGKHVLRGAIINGPGMSDFCVRFIDDNGKPVTNYTITNK